MKPIFTILLGLALSIGATAQTTTNAPTKHTTYTKAKALYPVPVSQATTADYFRMDGNQVRAVKGGVAVIMPADRFLSNGTVITPSGTVLTSSGKRIYLQNGETVDGQGFVTSKRCSEIAPEAGNGGTCMVQ